jgi:hypothetical protein
MPDNINNISCNYNNECISEYDNESHENECRSRESENKCEKKCKKEKKKCKKKNKYTCEQVVDNKDCVIKESVHNIKHIKELHVYPVCKTIHTYQTRVIYHKKKYICEKKKLCSEIIREDCEKEVCEKEVCEREDCKNDEVCERIKPCNKLLFKNEKPQFDSTDDYEDRSQNENEIEIEIENDCISKQLEREISKLPVFSHKRRRRF